MVLLPHLAVLEQQLFDSENMNDPRRINTNIEVNTIKTLKYWQCKMIMEKRSISYLLRIFLHNKDPSLCQVTNVGGSNLNSVSSVNSV